MNTYLLYEDVYRCLHTLNSILLYVYTNIHYYVPNILTFNARIN